MFRLLLGEPLLWTRGRRWFCGLRAVAPRRRSSDPAGRADRYPATCFFVGVGAFGAGEGNRTLVISLEGIGPPEQRQCHSDKRGRFGPIDPQRLIPAVRTAGLAVGRIIVAFWFVPTVAIIGPIVVPLAVENAAALVRETGGHVVTDSTTTDKLDLREQITRIDQMLADIHRKR
jgi:hypothetical protein